MREAEPGRCLTGRGARPGWWSPAGMGETTGLSEVEARRPTRRPVSTRVHDWQEVYNAVCACGPLMAQPGRCMGLRDSLLQQNGLPAGNLIFPIGNDPGLSRPLAPRRSSGCTPPITSPNSPAACVRHRVRPPACWGSNQDPVTIKQVRAWRFVGPRGGLKGGSHRACRPVKTGKRIAVIGLSGPVGPWRTAAAIDPRGARTSSSFERADRIGRAAALTGIPEFQAGKKKKRHLNRRVEQMRARRYRIPRTSCFRSAPDVVELRTSFDALVLAGGAHRLARSAHFQGREPARYPTRRWSNLPLSNSGAGRRLPRPEPSLLWKKRVVIIGWWRHRRPGLPGHPPHRQGGGVGPSVRICPGRPYTRA